jgi:pyruvate/2-oxoglutarate dehydrogenase complex dihydrolipoamide dehydrogenase (E3) component
LLYRAELIRTIEGVKKFGIDVDVKKIDFETIMWRMRTIIRADISIIREAFSHSKNIGYYPAVTEFTNFYGELVTLA